MMLAQELDFSTDYSYDSTSQLSSLKNYIATEKKGGKEPPNIEEISLLEKGYPAIRKSGTRLSGNQAIRDNVPDTRITQSPSPGSPDNQITLLEQSNSPKSIEYLVSSIEHLLFSPKDAEAQSSLPLNSSFTYTYDLVGNRLSMAAPNGTHNYTYNNIYELTNVSGAQAHSYAYDNVGNRTAADGVNYSANNLNQYTQISTDPYRYDANGNLIDDNYSTFTYDAENRLTISTHQPYTTYQYDGFGRRIQKNNDNERIFYYIYDGDRIIEERLSDGSLWQSYTYGEGIDEILTSIQDRASSIYYYFYDGLGSVTDISDNSGNVVESYQYDVYGQPNITSTIGNRFMFTGREYDEESGLYYLRARYYSPSIGRFLQRDPVTWGPDDIRSLSVSSADYEVATAIAKGFGLDDATTEDNLKLIYSIPSSINQFGSSNPSSLHPYLYCDNNSINWVDPSGFDKTGNKGNFPKGYYYPIGNNNNNNKYTPYYNPIPFRGSPYYGNFRTPFTSAALGAYAFKPILTNVYSVILSQAIFRGPKGYFWAKFGIELFTGGPASVPKTLGVFKVNPPPAE